MSLHCFLTHFWHFFIQRASSQPTMRQWQASDILYQFERNFQNVFRYFFVLLNERRLKKRHQLLCSLLNISHLSLQSTTHTKKCIHEEEDEKNVERFVLQQF
jgi:hypothetical protein